MALINAGVTVLVVTVYSVVLRIVSLFPQLLGYRPALWPFWRQLDIKHV